MRERVRDARENPKHRENRGAVPVTVELEASGFFTAARTYGGGRVRETALPGEAP